MENRKKPANPVPDETPSKKKPDPFEPEVSALGPKSVDGPTPPPSPGK